MRDRRTDRVIDATPWFHELDGASLEWWGLAVSHGEFRLLASGSPRGLAHIGCAGTRYLDLPISMHNVHLRVASEEETEAVRQRLSADQRYGLEKEDHLVIECDEGTFSIWVGNIAVWWVEEPDVDVLRRMAAALWPKGLPDNIPEGPGPPDEAG